MAEGRRPDNDEKSWQVHIKSGSQPWFTNRKTGTITCFVEGTGANNKVLYALTAGHCVKKGDSCMLGGEIFGECILSYNGLVKDNKRVDKNDAHGITVDVAVIEMSKNANIFIKNHFYVNKEMKTVDKVLDPQKNDIVCLCQPDRNPPPPKLIVELTETNIPCYSNVFILKNPVDGKGSGIVGGDSGSCVVQDAGPEKVDVYGMVVAKAETGDAKQAEAIVTCNDSDADRDNPKSLGIAIPMSRILAFLSDELGTPLVLSGMVSPIPLVVEALVGEEENQQREHVPTTVPRRKMHNLTDTC